MLGEKVCTATLDVPDPIDFAASAGRGLVARLRKDFEGRCYLGAYIVRVLSVLERSAIRISGASTSAQGSVDVQFLAEVLVLGMGDLLAPIEILRTTPTVVGQLDWRPPAGPRPGGGGPSPPARISVSFLPSRGLEALAAGHLVAARVVSSVADVGQPAYSAAVDLLACAQTVPVFRLRGSLGPSEALARLADCVEAELKARAGLPPEQAEALAFVERAFYAFAAPAGPGPEAKVGPGPGAKAGYPEAACPAWTGPPGLRALGPGEGEPRDLLALARAPAGGVPVEGVWARPLELYRSAPCAVFAEAGAAPPAWPEPIEGSALPVFVDLLRETLGHLAATRALAAVFCDRAVRDRHAGLWAALRSIQQRPK